MSNSNMQYIKSDDVTFTIIHTYEVQQMRKKSNDNLTEIKLLSSYNLTKPLTPKRNESTNNKTYGGNK